jgi:hypothetical protein
MSDPAGDRTRETNPLALLPEFFERYFAFFRPGHREGVVPSRIKELARLKIAALNQCDT